jgi:hypothetical protein
MKNIKEEIKKRIKSEDIKVHSKSFFKYLKIILLSIIGFLALLSIYLFNISFYLPRRGFSGGHMVPMVFLRGLPWPLLFIGAFIIALMIYLYRKYEGGYKKSLFWTILIVSLIIIGSGALFSATSLNERMEHRPGIRRIYDGVEKGFGPRGGRFRDQRMPFRPENNMKDFY